MQTENTAVSLYHTLTSEFNWEDHTIIASLETVKNLSYSIENVVMKDITRPTMFVGFQKSAAFEKVAHRYQHLDEYVERVFAFAHGQVDSSQFTNIEFFNLYTDDMLNNEWFLVIISKHYAMVFSAIELDHATDRQFRLLWSFSPQMVKRAIDIMIEKVDLYDQAQSQQLIDKFKNTTIPVSDIELVNQLTLEMIQFQEDVQNRLRFTHRAMLEAYEYNQRLIDLSPALIFAMNTAQQITLANQSMVKILEIPINDMLGQPLTYFCATEDDYHEFVKQIHVTLDNADQITKWNGAVKSRSGTVYYIEWHMRLIQHHDRLTLLTIGRNITELRETQKALLRNQRQMEDILESVKTYIYMLQYNTRHSVMVKAYSSPVLAQLTGYQEHQVAEDVDFWIHTIIHPDDRQLANESLDKLLQGQSIETQYRIVCRDGTVKWVLDSARAYVDEINDIISIYGTVEDITERLQMQKNLLEQEKLRLALKNENQALKMRNEFITTVSHEFRTPLASILSATEMLGNYEDRLTPESKAHRLQIIRDQVESLRRMLDDINVIIESQTNKVFSPTSKNIEKLINSAIDEVKKLTETTRVFDVQNSVESDVMFDSYLMGNVLQNLLLNAVNYSTDDRPITIEAFIDDDMLNIHVTNFGIGIDPDDAERIFESFYRGKNHNHQGGTGLGLRIVKDFVERHKGTVDFTSTPDDGTCFRIRIPYQYAI